MKKAMWIWYPGDYELYHHLLLSCQRQEHGCDYPCAWHICSPEKSVRFHAEFEAFSDTTLHIYTHSKGMVRMLGKLWPVNSDIPVPAGKHGIVVELYDLDKFPSLFIDNEYIVSDGNWLADNYDRVEKPVNCLPDFDKCTDNPAVFPFCYRRIYPETIEKMNNGILYDFGKETFGIVTISAKELEGIKLTYGESRSEALDFENAIIRETLHANDNPVRPARALRYLFVQSPGDENIEITLDYEYLALEDKASFVTDNELVRKIWDVCAYTFHLNSRQFFLDGIKRDRWVWSGDAYQSFMINRCLFYNNDITQRTIKALLGKPPYTCHINTINDYSAYLIFAVWEHYYYSGNKQFLTEVYPNIKELYRFIISRLDNRGYVVPVNRDWIFIDWGELDKTGANCFEQILLWNVYRVMGQLSSVMGEEDIYTQNAESLKAAINRDFWNIQSGAYIDSADSGKNFVSRQTNVMAILLDFVNEEQKNSIITHVFDNPDLPQIKTPYFKLYELSALCKCNKIELAQDYIESYWGQMLSLGATSVWEEFNPLKNGNEHYEMYSEPYGKSLCHAWGAGPILLLTAHIAGIKSNGFGKGYTVEPHPGKYRNFTATAPIENGTVWLKLTDACIMVKSDVAGGELIYKNKLYPIPKDTLLTIER